VTDRRTDILPRHSPRYAYESRGKNGSLALRIYAEIYRWTLSRSIALPLIVGLWACLHSLLQHGSSFKKKESPLFQVCQVAIVVYELKRKPCSWLQANLKTFNAVNSLYNVYLYQKLVMLWIGNLCHINVPYKTSVSVFYYNYMPTFYCYRDTTIYWLKIFRCFTVFTRLSRLYPRNEVPLVWKVALKTTVPGYPIVKTAQSHDH